MNRRQLIKNISLITGAAFIGSNVFLTSCKRGKNIEAFTDDDFVFLDEIAETIIPETDTPGAKATQTGRFIAQYISDCYSDQDKEIVFHGIEKINEAAKATFGNSFLKLNVAQKEKLLIKIDTESKKYNLQKAEKAPTHYFTMLKQLTLLGFFTSKVGITEVLRYNPVPGKYEGCIAYNGENAWT